MSSRGSFEERTRAEVERIKAKEAAEEERAKEERMRDLAEQAQEHREVEAEKERRQKSERDAKLRQAGEDKDKAEEERAKEGARRQWRTSGGTEAAFERAWPSMWEEMLKRRTMDADQQAREGQRALGVSRSRVARDGRGASAHL